MPSTSEHRASLVGQHFDQPQNLMIIRHAFDLIAEGLKLLGSLGHPFHLVEGTSVEGEIWPKVYFHIEAAPNGRLVNSLYDLQDLGPGWYPSLDQAQHADGMATQFDGRGGVRKRDVPMLIGASAPIDQMAEFKARMKAEFLASQGKDKANGPD